jgi:hypothetical protein
MVKPLCLVLALSLADLGTAFAQSASPSASDTPVQLAYVNSDLSDVLKIYAQLTGRKVWV